MHIPYKENHTVLLVFKSFVETDGSCRGGCDYNPFHYNYGCICDGLGDLTWSVVHIVGKPVRTTPNIATYTIEMYSATYVYANEIIDLIDTEPFVTFTLCKTMDSVYNTAHTSLVKKYMVGDRDAVYEKKFKGIYSIDSYMNNFILIIKDMLLEKKKSVVQSNEHIGKRKKKNRK